MNRERESIFTFGAEASIIPLAFSPLDGRVNVKIQTIVTTVAESKGSVEATFGDPTHVVLVQIVALVSLLAKTSKPMLAYRSLVGVS